MGTSTISKDRLTRDLKISAIRAMEGSERKFRLSFSSEEPYERWFGTEILDHTEDCVNLTRINEMGCVLFNHNRDYIVGKVSKAWIENNRGEAEIEFDTDEDANKIYEKVKSGTLKGVSVGYKVDLWEEVKANKKSIDGRFTGPCSVAKKWWPFEISIVSVPADSSVGVGRALGENKQSLLAIYEKQLLVNKNRK